MFKKVAFLCVNPLENFLPPAFQGNVRDYYQWMRGEALLREENLYCQERIEIYGESKIPYGKKVFGESAETLQLLYVKSCQKKIIEEVCAHADLILVGMSGSKKECDRIYLTVLPWLEKVIFLFDGRICGEEYLGQMEREYKLKTAQMMEIKKLPSYLTEALMSH